MPLKTVGGFVPAQHLIMVWSTQVEPFKIRKKNTYKSSRSLNPATSKCTVQPQAHFSGGGKVIPHRTAGNDVEISVHTLNPYAERKSEEKNEQCGAQSCPRRSLGLNINLLLLALRSIYAQKLTFVFSRHVSAKNTQFELDSGEEPSWFHEVGSGCSNASAPL